jgi:8-oxo-dGTP pyrophosphatase MutT (NUDIX family)|tara:strand:- start:339 stop:854 length:516 start_codon:yes stop_codon:yes gene_type:complete
LIENLKYKNLRIPSVKLSKEYASVAMLIYQDKELVLIKRSEELPTHKGHIAFPGGKKESGDESIVDTAIREACEELLLERESIIPFGMLEPIDTVEYKFEVYPILCKLEKKPNSFNTSEVQEVYFVPLEDLQNENNWLFRGHYDTDWIFEIRDEILWGATAKMVRRMFNII